ncbi:MAG: hypothetical protein J6D27_03360 [Ruminiclostridium sp.]|nr:hypothetical protein [Ruminiclostridium sp.]
MKTKLKSTLILSIVIVMSVVSGCAVHNNNSVPEITTTTTSTESTTVKPEDTTTTPEGTNEPTVESEATTSQPEETTSTVTSEPETTTQATTTTPETVKPETTTTTTKPETTTSKPENKPQTTTTTPKPETSKPTEWQPHTHNYVLVSVIEEPIHTADCQALGEGLYKCETCGLSYTGSIMPECEYVNDRCTVCKKLHPDHIHEWEDYEWTEEVESYESVWVYICDCNRHFYTSAELDAHQATTGKAATCLDCGNYTENCIEYNPENPAQWRETCPTCGGHNLERYAKCGGWSNTYEERAITEEVTHHGKKCICGETQQID